MKKEVAVVGREILEGFSEEIDGLLGLGTRRMGSILMGTDLEMRLSLRSQPGA